MLRIGIIAGESSGDQLGAGLIGAIREQFPGEVQFEGVPGLHMKDAGCIELFAAERLAMVGLIAVLRNFRELKHMRDSLYRHFADDPPDVFIGIDAPDFLLGLEERLRARGVPTVHYVSPQVWAWRRWRIRQIGRATDLLLTLFPFEEPFYEQHSIHARYVGHPFADRLPLVPDQAAARAALGLAADAQIVALLPGSRGTELKHLADTFVRTAQWCLQRHSGLHFVVPLATARNRDLFEAALARLGTELPVTLLDGHAREALAAADAALMASGTATLEGLLLKCPMVVAYRVDPLTYQIARHLVKVDHVALPNLLAGERLVPEFVQHDAGPEQLGQALLDYLENPQLVNRLKDRFTAIHQELRQDTNHQAAAAVLELVRERNPAFREQGSGLE